MPLAAAAFLAAAPGAQEPARPRLEGRVVTGDAPVPSAAVVLHRVTPEAGGEIDTVFSSAEGSFAFDLPTVPDPGGRGEVYFASVEHLGVMYFGPAIHRPVQLDSAYVIEVHDTAVAPAGGAPLPLQMRYVVLEPLGEAWQVTDLFQVQNEGDRTLVAGEGAVWSFPLPAAGSDFRMGGDVPPDAVRFSDGAVHVSVPVPPGPRQFVVRYTIEELRLELALPGAVHAVELLVTEPAPPVEVEGLRPMEPVELDPGVTYRRFAGTELRDAVVSVRPGRPTTGPPVEWLGVGLGMVLAAAALWALRRRGPSPRPATAPVPGSAGEVASPDRREERRRLVLEVARLDERMEAEGLAAEEREALAGRRSALLGRIRELG